MLGGSGTVEGDSSTEVSPPTLDMGWLENTE